MSAERQQIRWRDRDALGHVNAAVFLTYLEEGRNAWLADVLGSGFGPEQYVIARVEIDFRAEIGPASESVESEHRLSRLGTSSLTFEERLLDGDGNLAAEATVVLVLWDPDRRTSRELTPDEQQRLAAVGAGR